MAFIIDRKFQYILAADANGSGFAEPPMNGVLAGDLLIMAWAANDDDTISIDDGGWTEIPNTNPGASTDEVRAYYKFATSDNEQCSTWSNTATNTNIYIHTLAVRGVDSTDPIIDSNFTKFTSGSNNVVEYPSLTSTANKQLCFYLSSSDGDPIIVGDHPAFKQLEGVSGTSDSMFYQYISNGAETIPSFQDSVDSDQTSALGFCLKDAIGSPAPLEIIPLKALTKIVPDNNNDSGWMEAVYASGIDISTGKPRVNKIPTLECFGTTAQYVVRVDKASSFLTGIVTGEVLNFASGATANFGRYDQFSTVSGGRGYLVIYNFSGIFVNDDVITGATSGNTAQIYSVGSRYQINVTGFVRSSDKIDNFFCFKSNGYNSLNLIDGDVYWCRDTSDADSATEGYWYQITTHASRFDEGSLVVPAVASATGTMSPYNMCNFEYNLDIDNDYPTGVTGVLGWKKSLVGSCKSYTTSADMSNILIALWHKTSSINVASMYYLMVDTSNNWKLWKIRSKYTSNYISSSVEHNLISPDSVDTPIAQTTNFNSNAIKYNGILFRESSDLLKNGCSTYDQYIVNTQTIEGGGDSKQVTWSDMASALNSEMNDNGLIYDKTIQNIVPSQFVLSRSLKLSCEIGMNNQALSFPPQADGINNFLFNVDSGFAGLVIDTASGDIKNSLIASDRGAYWNSSSNDTIDYSGSIFGTFDINLNVNRTYENESWVNCGQINLTNGASLDNCTVNGCTRAYGVSLDTADVPTLSNLVIKNCSDYGISIAGTTDLTLDNITFSNNATKDLYFSATTGSIDVTVTKAGYTPTYYSEGVTVNLVVPQTSFKFSLNPSIINYEWRIYQVDAVGSMVGAVELSGEETATQDNQEYITGASIVIAVQIISQPNNDYEESITYYTLSGVDQTVSIILNKDNNN